MMEPFRCEHCGAIYLKGMKTCPSCERPFDEHHDTISKDDIHSKKLYQKPHFWAWLIAFILGCLCYYYGVTLNNESSFEMFFNLIILLPLCALGLTFGIVANMEKQLNISQDNTLENCPPITPKKISGNHDNFTYSHPQPTQTQPQTPPPPVSCPKCGSTQIQLVNKKWSLMTGFLTNKVDRVCVNCKTKF
ncbi:MAG: hypothetical protein VB100_14420 [Angelakisella sp.]|nr:hypothetical protein [Angelakisella sp.]